MMHHAWFYSGRDKRYVKEKKMRFSLGLVPLSLFLCALVWSCSETLHCQAQSLPQNEVDALKKIGAKLGLHWNFTVDPCSATYGWFDQAKTTGVVCSTGCEPNNCHVINILLSGQNLNGSLPDEFSNLTNLQEIDLSLNYFTGTIPSAWASIPLTKLFLQGNYITGRIPVELGKISTLQRIDLSSNRLEGPFPQTLGNLTKLIIGEFRANNFSGRLPKSLGNLTSIAGFLISGNPITGEIPSFIENWTQLEVLDIQATSLEGPFPPIFSTLGKITWLEVSNLKEGDGKFPPLQNMTSMQTLVLRNMSITDWLPTYIGNMTLLQKLDLSYNGLTGQIPENLKGLTNLKYLFLNNNNLTGAIPDWMLTSTLIHIDISYNSFNAPNAPSECFTGFMNMVSSYSSTEDNLIKSCLRRNNPCPRTPENHNLFINCGGRKMIVDGNEYQDDINNQGASDYHSYNGDKWAFSSTGYFMYAEDHPFIAKNVSSIAPSSNPNLELYMTARLSALSLTYYGLCLRNGNYTITLHFAEIIFSDDRRRRFFDVFIQGKSVLRDFNIAKEANGTGQAINRNFSAIIDSNTLEIHLQWTGQGTTNNPPRGSARTTNFSYFSYTQ